jgi:hypothetical protein
VGKAPQGRLFHFRLSAGLSKRLSATLPLTRMVIAASPLTQREEGPTL